MNQRSLGNASIVSHFLLISLSTTLKCPYGKAIFVIFFHLERVNK